MKKNKSVLFLTIATLMLPTISYAENNNSWLNNDNTLLGDSGNELIEISNNDFYLEPKEIRKGKQNPNGFAQQNTKNIPNKFEDPNYIEILESEIMRLEELPDDTSEMELGKKMPILKSGSKGENVKLLISALISNGFLEKEMLEENNDFYNQTIVLAVKEAQDNYGISVDGVAGPEVYRNLFISKNNRVKILKDWLGKVNDMIEVGRKEEKPFIVIVNIPSFTLHVLETNNKTEILQSKVIVGKTSSQTPIYRSNLSGLKYYPTWTPPMSVVKKNVLPNMSISGSMNIVDSRGKKIPISQVSKNDLLTGKYSVQQTPGTHNSLGILKFETDSTDAIYLHDTNNRSLFNKKNRAISLGCVRVQQWPELASLLASSNTDYVFENVNKKKTYIEKIDKIPLFYTNSLVDNVEGKVGFYKNVYNK